MQEEFMKKQAEEFSSKMREERKKKRRLIYRQYMKQCKLKLDQQLIKKSKVQHDTLTNQIELRKTKLMEQREQLAKRKQQREEQLLKDKEELKKYRAKKPLYKEIEDRFK